MSLNDLMTLAEVEAMRAGKPLSKGPSRLQDKTAEKKLAVIDAKAFKAEVWTRDQKRCRCCHRKVVKTIERISERGEVHHVHGRTGDLRFEAKAALLVCLRCHEKLTGKVNEKLAIIATATFTTRQGTFTDARQPVVFKRVA